MIDGITILDVIKRIKEGDYAYFNKIPLEERNIVSVILREMESEGKSKTLGSLYNQDYEIDPADMRTFISDKYYMGEIGAGLYPPWKEKLIEINDQVNEINEVIVRGAVGSGKTTFAVICVLHRIHHLLCLKSPQEHYGLIQNSPLVFGLFNIFKYLAEATAYRYFVNWTKMSPFFRDAMKRAVDVKDDMPEWLQKLNKLYGLSNEGLGRSLLRFPKGITLALGAQAIHALGLNLFGGILDEADMGRDKSVSDGDKAQMVDLYGQARIRMDTRFMQTGGRNPGILILISQVRHRDSFLEEHIAKVKDNPRTRVIGFPIWEIKKKWVDSGGIERGVFSSDEAKFKVAIGDQRVQSFIIKEENVKLPEGVIVIDVPESLRDRFEYNLEDAIRDLAGIPTYGSGKFISRRDKIYECYSKADNRIHPFTRDTVAISIDDDDSIIDYFVKEVCMRQHDKITGSWIPLYYPGAARAIHIDLAKNGDFAGLSMGCLGAIRAVKRFDNDGRPYIDHDHDIFIDFALRIAAKCGSEIDFSKIRAFVFYLHDIGFPIKFVSLDGWQSVDTMQSMKKSGFVTKLLSVDKKPTQYNYLRSTIYETRLDMYEYDPLTDELINLEDKTNIKGAKPPIDHPPNKFKDVSDAVCGVTARLAEEGGILIPGITDDDIKMFAEYFNTIVDRKEELVMLANKAALVEPKDINPMESIFEED